MRWHGSPLVGNNGGWSCPLELVSVEEVGTLSTTGAEESWPPLCRANGGRRLVKVTGECPLPTPRTA